MCQYPKRGRLVVLIMPHTEQFGSPNTGSTQGSWDHSTHEEFYDYYARESLSPHTIQRFQGIRSAAIRVHNDGCNPSGCEVLDVGCGAGTLCLLWAELGYRVHGIDVNGPLVELAGRRAASAGHSIDFRVGTAVDLPWPDDSMDICVAVELLEHIKEWEACLREFTRVLRPGGVLLLTTSNKICPKQHEFNLPLYSWYPGPLKRHFERLALTTRPQLANFAKYPAVNWFSFYSLRSWLAPRGFRCSDRFDVVNTAKKGALAKWVVGCIRNVPGLRFLGHFCTPGTILVGLKIHSGPQIGTVPVSSPLARRG